MRVRLTALRFISFLIVCNAHVCLCRCVHVGTGTHGTQNILFLKQSYSQCELPAMGAGN